MTRRNANTARERETVYLLLQDVEGARRRGRGKRRRIRAPQPGPARGGRILSPKPSFALRPRRRSKGGPVRRIRSSSRRLKVQVEATTIEADDDDGVPIANMLMMIVAWLYCQDQWLDDHRVDEHLAKKRASASSAISGSGAPRRPLCRRSFWMCCTCSATAMALVYCLLLWFG